MKIFSKIILWGLLLLVLRNAKSQSQSENANVMTALDITYNKTTTLVFPAVIKSVDRGSRDLLVQKTKGIENVLQLKAARHGFPQTNLTVITSDGKIHEFAVMYAREPASLVVNVIGDVATATPHPVFQTLMTESDLENYSSKIIQAKRTIRFNNDAKGKISLSLHGIYIREDVIFYRFKISNTSNINYDVDFLRFYIQDRQKVKRTASQEVDINPIYVHGSSKIIKARSTEELVCALEKFTIPDAKRLRMEMFEKNGGRNLNLSIKNKTIVNALLID